jgi:thiamine pyrophosphokinase
MAPARGVVSEGLRWPVAGLAMTPDGRIGTSNLALGGPVRIGFNAPKVLVILPLAQLRQAAGVLMR